MPYADVPAFLTRLRGATLGRRPAKPSPIKPNRSIAQVEGSGKVPTVAEMSARLNLHENKLRTSSAAVKCADQLRIELLVRESDGAARDRHP
jgi:hypothetical protein